MEGFHYLKCYKQNHKISLFIQLPIYPEYLKRLHTEKITVVIELPIKKC
jgi:hypothetical protein